MDNEPTSTGTRHALAWWRSGTIYQIYPHSFADSDSDGLGDLRGIIQHVDHLAWLGVDAVWLSPIYPSPQHDNGYDVADYRDIDPRFGTLDDLDDLIARLHDADIRLVLDLVVNHTSSEHPWFLDSSSSRRSDRRDWYIWRDPRPGFVGGEPGAEPTNWGSYFGGSAWKWDARTGQYYLHLFAEQQPDLNWENPAVREAVHDMMKWWLDRGVDGFRMDVINLISKPAEYSDGRATKLEGWADPSPFVTHGPHLETFLAEMHAEVFADRTPDLVRIGETPGVTIEQAQRLTRSREAGLDMVFAFEHVEVDREHGDWLAPLPLHIPSLRRVMQRWQTGLGSVGWNSLYANNHDQPRMVSRFGDPSPENWAASAKAVALAFYLQQGTMSMYQGEEIGMIGATLDGPEDLRDISSRNYFASAVAAGRLPDDVLAALRITARDNARTPMHWTGGLDRGFGSASPWMRFAEYPAGVSVERQKDDPASILYFYRQLIAARHRVNALAEGSTRFLDTGDSPVIAYERVTETERFVVVANLSASAQAWPDELADAGLTADRPRILSSREASHDALAPWEALLIDATGV
ncbi:glycoside hydrolase family 13 protein [Leifsonia sp. AG29]|uniref:glycoside hydrolase family 13 protein n=1 Tax=Leifsonia sp. AG29 TaxID=2598860 RepID=UPI00131CA4A1|nr:alpha-glucosidase [Leifsonia sp. AG29]